MKKKLILEYTINSSIKVLFPRLSTPGGLSEWFADNVNINGNLYSFFWENTEQKAEILQRKENKYIRFRWLDSEEPESLWFEFRLNTDELTGDTALIITDFAEDEDKDSTDTIDKGKEDAEYEHAKIVEENLKKGIEMYRVSDYTAVNRSNGLALH